jgi:DNA-binding protein H-NS
MNRNDFKSMSTDELWALHEEIATRLAAALTAEKSVLENRLRRLQRGIEIQHATDDAKSSHAKSSSAKSSSAKPSHGKSSHGKSSRHAKSSTERRPYPAVVPKYRNPERPSETWAGRGKKPRWLAAQLKSGKRIDDFRIRQAA